MARVNLTNAEVMAAILAEYQLPNEQPDDITLLKLTEPGNRTGKFWRDVLEKKVKAGEMTRHRVRSLKTGRPIIVYRTVVK